MLTIMELRQKKAKFLAVAEKINDEAGEDITESQQADYDAAMQSVDQANAQLKRAEALDDHKASMGIQTRPEDFPDVTGGELAAASDPKRGFGNYGQYLQAVHQAAMHGSQIDDRLKIGAAAPTTYGNEGAGADGGYLVPPEFAAEVFMISHGENALVSMTDNTPVTGNSMTFPADETTPWGTNGIRAYWDGEAAAATQTKPLLKTRNLRLNKLMALVPVTDELLADAPALSAYLTRKTGESIQWKTDNGIVNGTGAGQPKGIAGSSAIVTVAKEASQTAATINANNVAKMFGRLPAGSMANSVWLINNDAYNQLITMTISNQPIWTSPNEGMKGSPAGMLLGRPVIVSQTCQTLGALGDIYLVDLMAYRTITKSSGIEVATSMHVFFDAAATAFRAIYRMDGEPSIQAAFAPSNGASTLSPFVQLAVRA